MPKVSVITPIYADIPEKIDWLREAIESVRRQTFTDWEMIILDDCSPHPPTSVQLELADDDRLRWVKTAINSGPASTRNTGAELALSPCLLPLDADDLLGSDTAIERMYTEWEKDKTKIIFGNLQRMIGSENLATFRRESKVIELGQYSFDENMKLMGIMPVTAMHSIKCFDRAGGWKESLSEGLEDVEYWLAAGKAGCCGEKINELVLVYRRQAQSRTHKLKFIDQRFEAVQTQIRAMHPDIYKEGNYPMSCCGGKGAQQALAKMNSSMSSPSAGMVTTLDGFPEEEKVWVLYDGPKKGKFDIKGQKGKWVVEKYVILGTGHTFQVHRHDYPNFQKMARLGYKPTTDPRNGQEIATQPAQPPQDAPWTSPVKGQLATIERLDRKGAEARGVPYNPPPPANPQPRIEPIENPMPSVTSLDLAGFEGVLSQDGWTVAQLAQATEDQLRAYPGIGAKRAAAIIQKAKDAMGQLIIPA